MQHQSGRHYHPEPVILHEGDKRRSAQDPGIATKAGCITPLHQRVGRGKCLRVEKQGSRVLGFKECWEKVSFKVEGHCVVIVVQDARAAVWDEYGTGEHSKASRYLNQSREFAPRNIRPRVQCWRVWGFWVPSLARLIGDTGADGRSVHGSPAKSCVA